MPNLGPNFYPKLVQISSEVGMKPEDLLAVMISESGLNPGAVEQKFKGSGLIGFMPDTLKGLGFKGGWQEFSKLSGEQQLDYVKMLVQNYKNVNGGKPLESAAHYYVANFWPVALKLPGIKQGNPNTAFIESKPEVIEDPKTKRKYSKKYYDVGVRIDPSSEINAYKYNPLFDKDKKGYITYGDMMKQVEMNRKNKTYQSAVATMSHTTGYTPGKESPSQMMAMNDKSSPKETFWGKLNKMLSNYLGALASNHQVQKKFLDKNQFLIRINSSDLTNSIEYSRILCEALEEELSSRTYVRSDGKANLEVECKIYGNPYLCKKTIHILCDDISNAFKFASKHEGVEINTEVLANEKSTLDYLDDKLAGASYRKFRLHLLSKQG